MTRRTLLLFSLAGVVTTPTSASSQQAAGNAPIDLEGIWNSATATPIQRPRDLGEKAFFTPDEAMEWERQFAVRNQEPPPGTPTRGTGTYNTFYREYGSRIVKTLRTSIVTHPADGRIPALTPAAEERRSQRLERQSRMENPEDLGLQDRCMVFSTSGPPMLPYSYNSNYQVIQTADAIVIHAEMIHDARIIYLDGRPHPPEHIRPWGGHSVGRWEGDTLVVDTRNFKDDHGLYGPAGGNYGWDRDLHVVERFSLYDDETLLYRFEIDNPTAFTEAWRGEITMSRTDDHIYEYACHEGNYSLEGVMRGARFTERRPPG